MQRFVMKAPVRRLVASSRLSQKFIDPVERAASLLPGCEQEVANENTHINHVMGIYESRVDRQDRSMVYLKVDRLRHISSCIVQEYKTKVITILRHRTKFVILSKTIIAYLEKNVNKFVREINDELKSKIIFSMLIHIR